MEATIKNYQTATSLRTETLKASAKSKFWENVEFNRFGIISILLVVIGCIGGFAAAFGAKADVIKLAMIAFPTIISLALTLAVAPMRVIIWVSATAILLDLLVFVF